MGPLGKITEATVLTRMRNEVAVTHHLRNCKSCQDKILQAMMEKPSTHVGWLYSVLLSHAAINRAQGLA